MICVCCCVVLELLDLDHSSTVHYPAMTKTMRQADQQFILHVEAVRGAVA